MIYFIQNENTKAIKIGYSIDVQKRLAQLQTAVAERLILIGQIPGEITDERDLHERFRDHHVRGEWFDGTKGLAEELTAMCGKAGRDIAREFWLSDENTSQLETIVSLAARCKCMMYTPENYPPGSAYFTPCGMDSDPSFDSFLASDDCEYNHIIYFNPLWSAAAFLRDAVHQWELFHKPGPPRLFCDAPGTDWRRPRLQLLLEAARNHVHCPIDSYVKQITDTGRGIKIYWRHKPSREAMLSFVVAWREAAGLASYMESLSQISGSLNGELVSFREIAEYIEYCDSGERTQASNLKVVG